MCLPVPLDLQVDRRISLQTTKRRSMRLFRPLAHSTRRPEDLHALLYEARRMGVSLQLVNIARDIVPDSVELRRCYLPADMFDKDDAHMQAALLNGDLA